MLSCIPEYCYCCCCCCCLEVYETRWKGDNFYSVSFPATCLFPSIPRLIECDTDTDKIEHVVRDRVKYGYPTTLLSYFSTLNLVSKHQFNVDTEIACFVVYLVFAINCMWGRWSFNLIACGVNGLLTYVHLLSDVR